MSKIFFFLKFYRKGHPKLLFFLNVKKRSKFYCCFSTQLSQWGTIGTDFVCLVRLLVWRAYKSDVYPSLTTRTRTKRKSFKSGLLLLEKSVILIVCPGSWRNKSKTGSQRVKKNKFYKKTLSFSTKSCVKFI